MSNEHKTYTFELCKNEGLKICSNCSDCHDEPQTIERGGRTYEVQGQALLNQAKKYQAENKCSYEQALLNVSSNQR